MLEQSKTPTPKMSIENTPEATVTPSKCLITCKLNKKPL